MEYRLVTRPYRRAEADTTVVAITSNDPYTHIERELAGNKTNLPDDQLIQLVLERVNMEIDPSSTLARLQETVHQAETALKASQENLEKTETTQVTIRRTIMEMNETLITLMNDVDELKEAAGKVEEAEGEDAHDETTTTVDGPTTTEGGE